ncbi:hypothetical protein R6G69_07935, partial [Actinotignum urinale]|nr:hypothetical protein [Actinotignum urinale]
KELTDKSAGLGQAFGAWVKANPGNATPSTPSNASNDNNSGAGYGQGSSQGSSRYGQRTAPRSGGNSGGARPAPQPARPAPQPAPAQPAKPAPGKIARIYWVAEWIGGQDSDTGYYACYDANGNKVYAPLYNVKAPSGGPVSACWQKVH